MTRNTRVLMSVIYWAFVVYLFVPLVLMVTMGFKDSKFIGFPIRGWTLDWYSEIFRSDEVLGAFGYTMAIALSTTCLSLVIGTWIAAFLGPHKFRGKLIVFALACMPAVIPGIISAISLRIYIQFLQLDTGMAAIILGHTIHNVPFVALVVMARLATLPQSHIEAARDLGADQFVAFSRVTLPYLKPALIGAGVFCMLLSFDDFVRSFFLGSYQPTLPVLIFAKLRSGMSPEINAISTVVLVITAILGIWAERSMRRMNKGTSV
ncbi:ABC transporter permease [Mesorhizobium sp. WSM2239]|uniref:ABC transporter permease n=2 Tax=unclassified Mesorhizobium TaxID=325217 RepID=A0AAU8DJW6_9HYPH